MDIIFSLIFGASEDFVKVSEKILKHQIEFIYFPKISELIRNFCCLAVSDGFIFL